MSSILEVRQAELEKVTLEVDTEVLYLNTTGLRKLAVWIGIREARVSSKGRVEVLRDVRSYVTRGTDGEDNIEGKIASLTRIRNQIRELMQEPDNWEQTPSHHHAMVSSLDSQREVSVRRRSDAAAIPVERQQPIIQPRQTAIRERPTPAPRRDLASSVMSGRTGGRRVLPNLPSYDISAVNHGNNLEDTARRTGSRASSSRRSLPATPLVFNSLPSWNLGGRAGENESLMASLARIEYERQRDMAPAHDSDDTQQLLSESGEEDVGQQGTFTIEESESEENLRIQELQNEIERLALQRKRKILSSKSTSSSSSTSTTRVLPKVPRRRSGDNSSSSNSGSKSSSERYQGSLSKDVHNPVRKSLRGSGDDLSDRQPSSRSDRRRNALSSFGGGCNTVNSGKLPSRSDRHRNDSSGSSGEDLSSYSGSSFVTSKKTLKGVPGHKLRWSPRREVGVSYPRSPLSDMRRKTRRRSSPRHQLRRRSVSFPDSARAEKSRQTGVSGCTVGDLKDAWRREFKIKGQIGKIGDKENKLDFLSVKRQIQNGLKKGHKETEIIEAVVNCTTAGTTLRSFLQSSTDLSVEILLDILRSYFQEADTVELLQQLSTARQDPKEDPQTFLIALLDLKNRIVRNEDDDIGFSPETVMKIMLKTLESGLADDGILNSIRPFLCNPSVSDNILIREMSHAVVLEKKRKEKSKTSARVNVVTECPEMAQLQQQLKDLQKQQESNGDSAQIAKLQATLNQLVSNQPKGKKPIYGCRKCKAEGTNKTCSHCFVCGEEGHKVENCPKKKEKEDASNSNRSPARD